MSKNKSIENSGVEAAEVAYESAKAKVAKAKHAAKTASKDITKIQADILKLKVEKAKAKKKAKKLALKIEKLKARVAAKSTKADASEKPSEQKVIIKREPEEVVETAVAEPEKKRRGPKPKSAEEKAAKAAAAAASVVVKKKGRRALTDAEKAKMAAGRAASRAAKLGLVAETSEEIDVKAGRSAAKEVAATRAIEPEAPAAPVEPEKTKRPRRSSEEVAAEKAAAIGTLKGDDFRIIEGIGLRATQILHDAGILAFQDLAASEPADLTAIMRAVRFNLAQPASWPQQAQLAADGKLDDLKELQTVLKRGV